MAALNLTTGGLNLCGTPIVPEAKSSFNQSYDDSFGTEKTESAETIKKNRKTTKKTTAK